MHNSVDFSILSEFYNHSYNSIISVCLCQNPDGKNPQANTPGCFSPQHLGKCGLLCSQWPVLDVGISEMASRSSWPLTAHFHFTFPPLKISRSLFLMFKIKLKPEAIQRKCLVQMIQNQECTLRRAQVMGQTLAF